MERNTGRHMSTVSTFPICTAVDLPTGSAGYGKKHPKPRMATPKPITRSRVASERARTETRGSGRGSGAHRTTTGARLMDRTCFDGAYIDARLGLPCVGISIKGRD